MCRDARKGLEGLYLDGLLVGMNCVCVRVGTEKGSMYNVGDRAK